jgi:hypothetical protein
MAKIDLSEFRSEKKQQCISQRLINELTEEDQIKVNAALEESSIDAIAIIRFIQKRNLDVKSTTMLRHRKKECLCYDK